MIESFEWKACDFIDGPAGGCLGGHKIFACPKDGTGRRFVVKYEEYGQSLNELVAQCLLKEAGLNSLPTAWISLFSDSRANRAVKWYGALEYVPYLKRLHLKDLAQADSHLIEDYFKHRVIGNCIFGNLDETEIYKDTNGTVYSLDYGDIDASVALLGIMQKCGQFNAAQMASCDEVVLKTFSVITAESILNSYLQIAETLLGTIKKADPDCLKAAAKSIFRAFAEISKDRKDDIMDSVEEHTNGITAAYYEGWLDRKQAACRKVLEQLA